MCMKDEGHQHCPAAYLPEWEEATEDEKDLIAQHAGTCQECGGCEGCDSGNPSACECDWLRRPHKVLQADWSLPWDYAAKILGDPPVILREQVPPYMLVHPLCLN